MGERLELLWLGMDVQLTSTIHVAKVEAIVGVEDFVTVMVVVIIIEIETEEEGICVFFVEIKLY